MKKKNQNLFLKSGDKIDLVAPGFSFDPAKIQRMKDLVQAWGYHLNVPKDILTDDEPLHASSDAARAKQITQALVGSPSKMVWCARGGYGSNRLIESLKNLKKPQTSKIFMGFSDNTSLHLFLNQQWGWKTYHGPHLDRIVDADFPTDSLLNVKNFLAGQKTHFSYVLQPENQAAQPSVMKKKKMTFPIRGGNLATFNSWMGTFFQPKLSDHFLFLEDTGERGYRLDRLFFQLSYSNVLKGCRGILLGPFVGGADPSGQDWTKHTIQRWSKSLKIPVWSGVPSGHGNHFEILPLESQAEVSIQNGKVTLSV